MAAGVLTLLWQRDRRILYIILSLIIGIVGLVYSRTLVDPVQQAALAIGSFGGLAFVIALTLLYYPYEASRFLCMTLVIPGMAGSVDIFFIRSSRLDESVPLWKLPDGTTIPELEDRYETELNLVTPVWLPQFPKAEDNFTLYLRHWMLFNERVSFHDGIALWKNVPVPHGQCVTVFAVPYDTEAFRGPEDYKDYPVLELVLSDSEDPTAILDVWMEAWRMYTEKKRIDAAVRARMDRELQKEVDIKLKQLRQGAGRTQAAPAQTQDGGQVK